MEFCEMDLAAIIKTCKLTRIHIRFYMYQIFLGLAYIQKHNLLHRDLKSETLIRPRPPSHYAAAKTRRS
jgi:serine/threonine protein kinase